MNPTRGWIFRNNGSCQPREFSCHPTVMQATVQPRKIRKRKLIPQAISKSAAASDSEEEEEEEEIPTEITEQHPYGVQPYGNLYMDATKPDFVDARKGLGSLGALEDALLQTILSELEPEDLGRVAQCSRMLYVFAYDDDLWKPLALARLAPHEVHFVSGRWRDAVVWARCRAAPSRPLQVRGVYSDVLFHSWAGASTELARFAAAPDSVERRAGLAPAEFAARYEAANRPVVLTGLLAAWPAAAPGPRQWTRDGLLARFGDTVFDTHQGLAMPLREYFRYAELQREENAMYLFDAEFGSKAPELLADYEVPPYFREDWFALLPAAVRPSYRWLLLGPRRSGSPFHKDPNCTSAWNGLLHGAKKWIFFPPDVTPPGVYPSADGLEVTTPLSVVEWFADFYAAARKLRPLEVVQRPGEVVFVPSGWWHSVLNLEDSIAVTQNFVSRQNLPAVLAFVRTKKRQELRTALEHALPPDVLAAADEQLRQQQQQAAKKRSRPAAPSLWSTLTRDAPPPAGFSLLSALSQQ